MMTVSLLLLSLARVADAIVVVVSGTLGRDGGVLGRSKRRRRQVAYFLQLLDHGKKKEVLFFGGGDLRKKGAPKKERMRDCLVLLPLVEE